jgi:hypothetical protein
MNKAEFALKRRLVASYADHAAVKLLIVSIMPAPLEVGPHAA